MTSLKSLLLSVVYFLGVYVMWGTYKLGAGKDVGQNCFFFYHLVRVLTHSVKALKGYDSTSFSSVSQSAINITRALCFWLNHKIVLY